QRDVMAVVGAEDPRGVLAPVRNELRDHPGGPLDDVVVGQHQTVGGQHHAGALEDLPLVVDVGDDVHESGRDLAFDRVLVDAGGGGSGAGSLLGLGDALLGGGR